MSRLGNEPAYPVPLNPGEMYRAHSPADGLTKRELFAMALAVSPRNPANSYEHSESALWALREADALLAALADEPRPMTKAEEADEVHKR